MQSSSRYPSVIVTGNNSINNLGVVRNLGREGIPVILLSSNRNDMVQYSRYVSERIRCPNLNESEVQFVNFLIDYGRRINEKYVIIPTSDREIMAISKHQNELRHLYLFSIPPFEVIEKLVNKKNFYKLLDEISIPHPKTYFPENVSELKTLGQYVEYPYLIKPAYSHLFQDQFHTKTFVINSARDLCQAIKDLRDKNLEVVIQEIIPGNETYMFYAYLNQKSEPIAICGYDKLRQFPPDFGSGSLCKSAWRKIPIDSAIQVLKALKYCGFAEPEFKRDPRDGEYKLLEINARTTTESGLPAKCGVNVEYIAYLDITGQCVKEKIYPKNGLLWVNESGDLLSCLIQLKRRRLGIKEVYNSLRGEKNYATATWDDPNPFFISLLNLGVLALKRLIRPEAYWH